MTPHPADYDVVALADDGAGRLAVQYQGRVEAVVEDLAQARAYITAATGRPVILVEALDYFAHQRWAVGYDGADRWL